MATIEYLVILKDTDEKELEAINKRLEATNNLIHIFCVKYHKKLIDAGFYNARILSSVNYAKNK